MKNASNANPAPQRAVRPCEPPREALHRKYLDTGAHIDCYCTEIARRVSHAEYVEAFYTTPVFKLERLILKWLVSKPSTDDEARRLAHAQLDAFAAWSVEERAPDQLLLCDYLRRTRSWLMVEPIDSGTRLYFGSVVVPVRNASGELDLGSPYSALLGFHRLYSRILLASARSRLSG